MGVDPTLTPIIALALAGIAVLPVGAQPVGDPRGSVIVDLTVLDDDGPGQGPGTAGRSPGLVMPGGRPPVSRLHAPAPAPHLAPGLAPAREPAITLKAPAAPLAPTTFAPARPEMREVTTPRSLTVEVTRAPRPLAAPSRTAPLVAPMTSPGEPTGAPAALPP
ncbi:MAG: hypothetical protein ACFCUO_07230, partial [Rhodospirillales bacterium]